VLKAIVLYICICPVCPRPTTYIYQSNSMVIKEITFFTYKKKITFLRFFVLTYIDSRIPVFNRFRHFIKNIIEELSFFTVLSAAHYLRKATITQVINTIRLKSLTLFIKNLLFLSVNLWSLFQLSIRLLIVLKKTI
jgi:hypothetical protein